MCLIFGSAIIFFVLTVILKINEILSFIITALIVALMIRLFRRPDITFINDPTAGYEDHEK